MDGEDEVVALWVVVVGEKARLVATTAVIIATAKSAEFRRRLILLHFLQPIITDK